jgi:biotin carboxylase
LTKNKLRTPITIAFSPKDDINKTTTKILKIFNSFPLVIKPYQGEGSIGVKIIKNKGDLKTALNDCAKFCKINPSMSEKFLVQEYIGGTEGFLNFYSFNGKHLLSDA